MGSRKDGKESKDGTMALYELRHSRARSQEEMAQKLKVNQPAVAKMERRENVQLNNLRRYVEALGGELEIKARFPDGDVTIRGGQGPNKPRKGK